MKKSWPRAVAYGVIAISVSAAAWWALREQPTLVDVAVVSAAPMRVTIREDAITRVKQVYTVSAPIAGHLSRTVIEEGDRVEAGKTVVAVVHPLDPPLIDRRTEAELLATRDAARSAVGIAQGELRRAETALALAEDQLGRALKLATGVMSESAIQKLANEVTLQKASVETAAATVTFRQAELASAEARLMQPFSDDQDEEGCCVTLFAPVTGTVLSVSARSEQAVAAGAVLAELGDMSQLEVVVDLLSADAVRLAPGATVDIVEWGGDRRLAGVLRRIDPAAFTKISALGIEEQRVNAVLDLHESDPRLGHHFGAVAELAVWECAKCLQAPIGALFRSGSQWKVFRVVGDRVTEAEVAIGHMNTQTAEVLSGLDEGDTVVVHPSDVLEESKLVRFLEAK
jgi:HlyD family secretion protein